MNPQLANKEANDYVFSITFLICSTLKTRFYEKKILILFLLDTICDDETKTKTFFQIYLHLQLNFKKIPIIAVNF